jgi:signal transduction histidine kinase
MRVVTSLTGRIPWLIALRWLAAAGLFLVISAARFAARLDVPLLPLYAGNLLLVALNGIYTLLYRKLRDGGVRLAILANAQISLDLLLLAYLIHFSGGLGNPFVFFFIFHMVVASILLSNRAAYLQASLAAAALTFSTACERLGILRSYHLDGFAFLGPGASSWPELVVRLTVFAATLFITVYMSTTIVNALRRRERELETLNRKLEESDRIKSRYVLTVSHDIRGPLSAIQSLLRVVHDGFTEPVPTKARELIERAEQRSQQLLSYLRDLLDLSRMRATAETVRSRISLSDLVAREVAQLQLLLEQKGLAISFEDRTKDSSLAADPEGLQHVVANLLENAIRYTPAGGEISLRLEDDADAGWICLVVSDTGIGIRQEDLLRIFDDFYRAGNARERAPAGTGLGLSIVKHVVDAHGGRLEVESRPGAGSTFTVRLPRNKTPDKGSLSPP